MSGARGIMMFWLCRSICSTNRAVLLRVQRPDKLERHMDQSLNREITHAVTFAAGVCAAGAGVGAHAVPAGNAVSMRRLRRRRETGDGQGAGRCEPARVGPQGSEAQTGG